MATVHPHRADAFAVAGAVALNVINSVGDLALFAARTFGWLLGRRPCRNTIIPNFYFVGVRSVPVIAITGTFIGMVLAVQSYSQFHTLGLASRLGGIINVSIIRSQRR